MLSRIGRRGAIALASAILAFTLTAGPALGHFCYREFNTEQAMNAAKSQAWLTAEEWLEFFPFIRADLESAGPDGVACANAIEDVLIDTIEDEELRLFMGPGLLAGGTLKNGKGNTPDHVGYLFAIPECELIFAGEG